MGARRAIGHAKATGRMATTGLRRQDKGRGRRGSGARGIGKRLRGKLS